MPRSIVLLAFAVLAAAPAAAQETAGSQATPRPARSVDECGKPEARPQSRRGAQRGPAARPEPRLLGQPVGQASASSAQAAAPSAAGTPSGAAPQASGEQMQPSAASSAAGTASGAASQASGQQAQPAGASSASSAAAPPPFAGSPAQASSMQAPGSPSILTAGGQGTQASAQAGYTPSYSGTSADTPPDARAARHNRNLLRLQGTGAGAGLRLGPAASVSVPTAFGVDAGEAFFGVAYQGRTRFTDEDDAAAVIGFGIGTRRLVALEAALTTYSTFRDTPLATGGISFKLHHQAPRQMSFAVGWENAILWGGSDDRGSLYATGTRLLSLREDPEQPFSAAVVTLGLGSGRFRFESDEAADRRRINVFGALGVRVAGPLSLVTDWTGQDLNVALSATPIRRVPFVVTAGVADLTGRAGDGARFILSAGYGLSFRQPL